MIKIGGRFPRFSLTGVISNDINRAFTQIDEKNYPNKWLVVFFWPKDFTFICPTEITEFGKLYSEFASRNAQILGISTDSEYVHLAWRREKEELHELPFPMLSDIQRNLSQQLGILNENEGVAERATFIVDPEQTIRFIMINDLNVGRNPQEVLRVLDALQTKGLCPCNWQQGEKTISVN
ncbi:MAG: peroxiredoxin [Coxiella endosymbiont of Dermacentor nuttalli]